MTLIGQKPVPAPMSEEPRWAEVWTHPLLGLSLLVVGLALGSWTPAALAGIIGSVQGGVEWTIGLLVRLAPWIILFSVLPALLDLFDTSGGKAPAVVIGLFAASSIVAGVFALIVSGIIFQLPLEGGGVGLAQAVAQNVGEIGLSPVILAVFWAFGGAGLVHGLIVLDRATGDGGVFSGVLGSLGYVATQTRRIFRLIFVKVVEGLGGLMEYALPVILFSIGTFVPVSVDDVAQEAGAAAVEFNALAWYFGTAALIAVVTLVFLVLVALLALRLTNRSVKKAFREYVVPVYLFAWSSASSAATIPLNLEMADQGLDAREGTRGFVIPLGATINLDGTLIATMLITPVVAAAVGIELTFGQLAATLVPLLFLTVGAPGIPAGMSILAPPVLAAVLGLQGATADAFVAVWFAFSLGITDQFRTAVNSVNNGFLTLIAERILYGPEPEIHLEEIEHPAPQQAPQA